MNTIRNVRPIDDTASDSIEQGGVIWISGYSASGKTTVGRKVLQRVQELGHRAIFLDGDDLRSIFANRWGYSREDRVELALVYFRLSSHLASQGNTVIISAVAMYDEVRDWFHANIDRAIEVYLSVPKEERLARDAATKNIYSKIGDLSDMYDEARNPDLKLENFGTATPSEVAERICEYYTRHHSNLSDRGRTEHWASFYSEQKGVFKPSPFAEYVSDALGRPVDMLEFGCGNGRDAAFFSRLGHRVTAIDVSDAAIALCKDKHADLPIDFIAGALDTVAARMTRRYDLIYSRFVIHAMPVHEEIAALRSAAAILKPGGRICIECRSINDPLAREGEVLSPTERIHGHYRRFIILDELVSRLEDNGFRVTETIESDGLAKFGDEDPVVLRVSATKVG